MVKRIRSIFSVNTSKSKSILAHCGLSVNVHIKAESTRFSELFFEREACSSSHWLFRIKFYFLFLFFQICADALECFSFVWFAFVFVLSNTQSTWIYFVLAVHLKAGQLLFQTPWDSHCCGVRPCCARSGCSLSLVPAPLMLWMVGKDENL